MFPVTITVHNDAQLNAILAAMGKDFQPEAPKPAQTEKPAQTKAQTTKVKDDPKPDAAPSSEPAQTQSDNSENSSKESTAANESDTEQPSYQDVAALITKVSRNVGRDAAVELLESFGAKRGPDLKPEQYADVVAACEKALA